MRNTPAIIIHAGGLAHEQPPDGHGARFSLGQQQGTPIALSPRYHTGKRRRFWQQQGTPVALSPRKRDFHGGIGVGRIQPIPLQEVVPLAPEPRPQPIPLQFRAGSKGPALIHFLTKRCSLDSPLGDPTGRPRTALVPLPGTRDNETHAHKHRLSSAGYNTPELVGYQEVCIS